MVKPKIFENGNEMLKYIQTQGDLYDPVRGTYVFLYGESSIAHYDWITLQHANALHEECGKEEYWGSRLGPGGWILSDPTDDDYKIGDYSNIDWCNDNYIGFWFDTSEDVDWMDIFVKYVLDDPYQLREGKEVTGND